MPDGENQAILLLAAGGAAAIFVLTRPRLPAPPPPPPPGPPPVIELDGEQCRDQSHIIDVVNSLFNQGRVDRNNVQQLFADGDLRAFIDRGVSLNSLRAEDVTTLTMACTEPLPPPAATFQIDGLPCTDQEGVFNFVQSLVASGAVLRTNADQLFVDGDLRAFIQRGFGVTQTGLTLAQIFQLVRFCAAEEPPPPEPPPPPPPPLPVATFQLDGQPCADQQGVFAFVQNLFVSGAVLSANVQQLFADGDLRAFIQRGFGVTQTGLTFAQISQLTSICGAAAPPPPEPGNGLPPPPPPPPPPVVFVLGSFTCNTQTLLTYINALAAIGRVSAQNVATVLQDGDVAAFIQRAFGRNGFTIAHSFGVGRACAGEIVQAT